MGRAGEAGDEVVESTDRWAISPFDLFRLRQGQLQPERAADLEARTVGLSAHEAPPEGELAPNGSGWLIGAGDPLPRLYPESYRRGEGWVLGICGFTAVYWAVASFAHPLPEALSVLVTLSLTAIPFILLGSRIALRSEPRRQIERAVRVLRLADVPNGTLVRVAGTIPPQATVPSLFRGLPAVLHRNRIRNADEMRGVDFFLDLDEGEHVKVAVRRAFLLESPTPTREAPACGPVSAHDGEGGSRLRSDLFDGPGPSSPFGRYESSVGPGDRVEVCGVVRHVPAPDLEGRFLRVPPMRTVLVGEEERPLLVRRG